MDRDTGLIVVLIGFPLLVGALVALVSGLARRAATVICPSCGGRIPKTDITRQGVSCAHCAWSVEHREPARGTDTHPVDRSRDGT